MNPIVATICVAVYVVLIFKAAAVFGRMISRRDQQ